MNIGELAVVVRPKNLHRPRSCFMIAYAMDPKNWRRDSFELARDDDILEGIAFAFAHHTRQAIQRGLVQGYRREEDALNTVRGHIRFGDQIRRRFDILLPIEVAFDEFTEDIEKNRLLKTAIHRLGPHLHPLRGRKGRMSDASGPPSPRSGSARTGWERCPKSAIPGWTSTTARQWNWRASS